MSENNVIGLLLAGGQSRRMGGGDKCLQPLAGRPLLSHAIDRLAPQVGTLLLNANGDPARFASFNLPVLADVVPDHAGPLAGVLTGLQWLADNEPQAEWIVSAPTDAPFFPDDLVARLLDAASAAGADIAVARSGERTHPVFALWSAGLLNSVRRELIEHDVRKIDVFSALHKTVTVDWPVAQQDPFLNVNRPADLTAAQALIH